MDNYFSVLNSVPEAIVVIDKNGLIRFFNPFAEALFNCTQIKAVGRVLIPFFKDELHLHIPEILEKTITQGPFPEGTFVIKNNSEKNQVFNITFSNLKNDDNEIRGSIIVAKNVSEMVQIEKTKQLQQKVVEAFLLNNFEESFHSVLKNILAYFKAEYGFFGYIDSNGDFVCPSMTYDIWDQCKMENKTVVFPKDKWGGIWGQSLLQKQNLIKNDGLFVPKGHITLKNALAVVIKENKNVIGQIVLANAATPFTEENLNQLNDLCNYISPLLKSKIKEKEFQQDLLSAKEKAEENEAMFMAALDNSQAGIAIAEVPTGRLKYVNQAGLMIRDKEYQEIAENVDINEYVSKWQILHFDGTPYKPEDVPLARAVLKGEEVKEEFIVRRDSHEDRFVLAHAGPVINSQGKRIAAIVVFLDITQLKQFQFELQKAKDKAEESDQLKSAFLANMSHEIRTPMNGILGFTDLLRNSNFQPRQTKEFIEIIHKSGNRMLNTLNDLIEISVIESGNVKIYQNQVSIVDTVYNIATFFTPEAIAKKLKLNFENQSDWDEDSKIIIDRVKLESILTNLIKNAIKFTLHGEIKIVLKNNENHLILSVSDTGVGIEKSRLKAIFNRFEQADIEDKNVFQGSGLGLSISKSYAEILGGKITAESEIGTGSRFVLTIPFIDVSKKIFHDSIPQQAPEKKQKELKTLIVEDDEASLQHFKMLFRKFPQTQFAKTGEHAIETCKENMDIDLILMDLKMPNMNGIEATAEIRKFNNNVVILAQTAHAIDKEEFDLSKKGFDDYILKPINKMKLAELLGKYFHVEFT